jgi:metallo-beta-lactamase family protein
MRSFRLPGLTMVRTVAQSKAINRIRGSAIVIAGSGMCTGGRIKHHLVRNIGRPESTILFVGYQAVGTLGRIILDGEKDVRIQGETHRVRARIARISGFSAHADRDELTRWLQSLGNQPDQTFITHGEPEAAEAFSDHLQNNLGWQTTVPNYLDKAALM